MTMNVTVATSQKRAAFVALIAMGFSVITIRAVNRLGRSNHNATMRMHKLWMDW
jgi:hypothetical protein